MDIRVELLKAIAKQAGKEIQKIYHDPEQSWAVEKKADNSPLTKADKWSNEVICRELKKHYPNIPIISEENSEVPFDERKDWEWFWLIDPLDGTKEFIKRNGEFTVNIALIKNGNPYAGFVFAPELDLMYFGVEGEGAYVEKGGVVKRLQKATFNPAKAGMKVVCSRSHMNDETKIYVEQFENPELVSAGSSLKLLWVASGDADVYPRLGSTMEWDTAAAHAVVLAAGGEVIKFEDGTPLMYNKQSLLNPYFIVR